MRYSLVALFLQTQTYNKKNGEGMIGVTHPILQTKVRGTSEPSRRASSPGVLQTSLEPSVLLGGSDYSEAPTISWVQDSPRSWDLLGQ